MNMKVENEMALPTTKSVAVMLLEPYAGKLARTVLRGESSRKGADLLDELSPTRFTATWQDAVNRCKDLADDGGGWRLPTHKEAVLIYILWPELRKAGLTNAAGGTGTDAGGDGTTCPYVTYDNNGTIKMAGKSESGNFYRCIRDL